MTREENPINRLQDAKDGYKEYSTDEALDMAIEALDRAIKALEQEPILGKIRAEIEKAVWEDVIVSLDGTDEVRIQRLEPDDVFEIIDKYKAENEPQERSNKE